MKWVLAIAVVFCILSGEVFGFVLPGVGRAAVSACRTRDVGTTAGIVGNARRRAVATTDLKMADVVVEFTRTGKTVTAVVGTPLSQMCAKAGVKVKYNCKKGDCATCTLNIDGRNVKACQGKVPSSRRIVKIKA